MRVCLVGAMLLVLGCSDDSGQQAPNPIEAPPGIDVEIKRPIKLRDETRVPQDDPSFESAEVTADTIVFHYKAKPTFVLQVGHVVVGSGKSPYLRRILEVVSRSDSELSVKTEPAQLTDAIADGAFRVSGKPSATDWVVDEESGISGRKVFLDTKIKLLSFDDNKAFNCEVSGGGGFDIAPLLEPAIEQFVFDVDIEPTLIPLGAKLVSAEFLIDASLTAGLQAKISRALAAQCGVDLVKLIGHKLNIDLSVAFPIGPIPGQLTIKIEPVLKLEGEAEAKVEVTFAPQFTVGAKAGVAYTEAAGWTHTFEVQKSGSLAPDFPDVGGEVSLAGKVTAGLKLATLLYDTAGPFIAVTHFGEGKLTAKVPECTWDATLDLGTDVTLGAELQVPVFDKTILELKKKFNLAKLRVKEAHGNLVQCADAGVEAGVDAGIEAGVDAGVDAAEDAAPADATPDVTPLDAGPSDATADQSDAGCPSPAWSHTTLPNADIDSNPNNVSVWTCGPNEFLSKLFIGEQATYHDEMGMICASSCDASQTREHVPVETFTSKTYYGCPAGERIIGVAYKDPVSPPPCNAPWAPDCPRDWLDVFAVFCVPESNLGATPTLQPNGAYTANANAPKVFLCTGGDEFIGFGVKSMPEWHSDYIDGITPVCRKQLP